MPFSSRISNRTRLAAFLFAAALATATLYGQEIEQSKGADPRVDYKELVKYGPWDDRNYQITQEDLAVLSPEEEKLDVYVPAFFRIAMRKAWPELLRSGPAQYPRSAPEIFRMMFGGLLVNGEIVNRGKNPKTGPIRTVQLGPDTRGGLPVNQEIKINVITGAAETAIAHNPVNPMLVIAGANGGSGGQEMYFSTDGGLTWTTTPALSGGTCCDPTVAWSSDGTIAYTATLGNCGFSGCAIWFYRSTDNGQTWGGRIDLTSSGSDKEYIHVDTYPTSPHRDNVYLTWHDGNVLQFARSRDLGLSFDPIQSFSSEAVGIGSDIVTDSAGDVYYFWPGTSSQAIWLKKSTDGGASFAAGTQVSATMASFDYPIPSMDTRNVFIYVAADADLTGGPFHDSIYAAWNDTYDPEGGSAASNHGRIVFAYSRDGGSTWNFSSPHPTNDADTVDRFNPWIQVDSSGNIHMVYYDTQRDLPARVRTDMFYTVSLDGGVTWETPERITAVQSDKINDSFEYGDYNGLSLTAEQILPIWTDNRAEAGDPGPDVDAYTADVVNQFSEPNFLLLLDQTEVTVCRPGSTQIIADIGQLQGFNNPVTLAFNSLPAGITATINTNPVTPPGQTTIDIDVDGSVAAGDYMLTLAGTATGSDGREAIITLTVQTDPPGSPALTAPADGEPNAGIAIVPLAWNPVAGAIGYHVQVSDDDTFGTTLIDEMVVDPAYQATGLTEGTVYYWRASAINSCGEGGFAAAFSFTANAETVFLVDQDDGSPDVRDFYTDTLDALAYSYKVHDYDMDGAPTFTDMASHPIVVWFTGDRTSGPDSTDLMEMETYVNAGGKIFLTSEDFLWPFRPDVPPLGQSIFGIATVDNDGGDFASVSGTIGSIFEGLGPYNLDFGGLSLSDFADTVTPDPPTIVAMVGDNSNPAALQNDNTVFMTFPFAAMFSTTRATSQDLQDVMTAVIDHLLGGGCAGTDLAVDAGSTSWSCDSGGQPAQLNAAATGGDGNYNYTWTPSTGLSNASIANPTAMPGTTTVYTITVRDGLNCVASDTVTVYAAPSNYGSLYDLWLTADATMDVNGDGSVDMLDYSGTIGACSGD